ncbi:tol-pal system YbgF family protein [Geodermatophilus sp. SYSU D00742]
MQERTPPLPTGPALPEWADARDLDPAVRQALRGLESRNAERVARHLVAAGTLVDEDPEEALAHARAARDRASRIAVVREAVGVAAYHAGDYAEAARELRAYRRMTGDEGYRAVLADCERALGRPEVALRLVREALADQPDAEESVELTLVEAGARQDLGEVPAARLVLEGALGGRPRPDSVDLTQPATRRLAEAYAQLLAAGGAGDLAAEWSDAITAHTPEELDVEFSEEDLPEDTIAAGQVGVDTADGRDEVVEPIRADERVPEAAAEHDATTEAGESAAPEDELDLSEDIEAEVAELLGETDVPDDDAQH